MALATAGNRGRNVRVGAQILLRRTDGSNRKHEATCTEVNSQNIGLCVKAHFVVGEVVELVCGKNSTKEAGRRARVMYRMADRYGLSWLTETAPGATVSPDAFARIAAARKLLAELKAAYDTLPAPHRGAVREALAGPAVKSAIRGCPGEKNAERLRPSA